ncbi:MAG: helix-turn-helix transcriptional regulator [Alphaproteobacteria bacterium]|nr:helix-turn-helix transcriptional regulator [Alphaproteobacteria bacterium]
MLSHKNIWKAIDLLAEHNGLSASGLAIKAGLSSTLFNPSKRTTKKRERWPSTESIAAILRATETPIEDFIALITPENSLKHQSLFLLNLEETSCLTPSGIPLSAEKRDIIPLPGGTDTQSFAVEIADKSFEPAYPEGCRLIVSPAEKPRRDDHVLVRMKTGDIHIKQLGREGIQKVELHPFLKDQPPVTLSRADISWIYRITWVSR